MISVRIGEELKRKMSKYKHINWSEVVRRAIIREIDAQERRDLAKALLLNEKHVIKPDKEFSSVEEIRRWREKVRWREE